MKKKLLLFLNPILFCFFFVACQQKTKKISSLDPEKNKQDSLIQIAQWKKETELDSLLNVFQSQKRYKEAIQLLQQLERRRDGRFNTPFYLLAKGNIYHAMHDYDSAHHYYKLATTSIDPLIATEAFHRLSFINITNGNISKAYDNYTSYLDALEREITNEEGRILQAKYIEEKLQNELNTVRIAKQSRDIWIITLSGILLLLSALSYILYTRHQRQRKEENMQRESECLNQENRLLKQSEELRALREKEALLRESLFRRMSVIHKIPSLEENRSPSNDNQKIVLTEEDWEEIRATVDGSYNQFTQRLVYNYPLLSQKDINFCCLIKINVSLQDLSDIYCISKTSISKRKFRLKKEKLHHPDSNETLDDVLQQF